MTKAILRELIIVLLLCLAIILVLGILLYEYVPITKTIPNQVAYTTPEDVKQELLSSDQIDESQIIMTYEVNNDDLNNYKRVQKYKPGKANPFSSYETQISGQNTTSNSANSSTQSNSGAQTNSGNGVTTPETSNNTSNETTSGGQFFQDKGTK